MNNVLLVDDEMLVIEAIKENIRWSRCRADQVYLCDNVNAAKALVAAHEIRLVISDIEMPGADGLALVRWLRENHPEIMVIFLTGYAEFEYAKAAVALKVEDYILKPVDYGELEEKILQALEKAEFNRREMEQKARYTIHSGELMGAFVRYVLATEEDFSAAGLSSMLARFHLDFSPAGRYILIWFRFAPDLFDAWELAEQVKNAITGAYRSMDTEVYLSSFVECKLLACLKLSDQTCVDMESVRSRLADIVTAIAAPCCCFITELLTLDQLVPMLRKLAERDAKNVLYQKRVILVGNRNIPGQLPPVAIDYPQWAILLNDGELDKLAVAVDFAVHSIVIAGAMDAEVLRDVYNNFMQLMYHYIGENFSSREGIVQDEQLVNLQNKALNSVEDFRLFVNYFTEQVKMSLKANAMGDVVDAVKKYIDEHLAEKLSRTDIAAYVSLNENYLSRLFHKEVGCSISDYILKKRVNMAKKLLLSTKLSVSAIGERVGYDTTTYFIRLFKREVGKTPKDFRKEMKI